MSEEKPYTSTGLTRVVNAARYSAQGLASAWLSGGGEETTNAELAALLALE